MYFNFAKSSLSIASAFIFIVHISACNWAKDKAKETIHKGGEMAGKAGAEIADGVRKGVEKSFANLVEATPELAGKGIELGRIIVTGTDSTSDNIVSVYMIFHNDFKSKVIARAVDENKNEFGRTSVDVIAAANEARYIEFVFDRRTNLDRNDKIILELGK